MQDERNRKLLKYCVALIVFFLSNAFFHLSLYSFQNDSLSILKKTGILPDSADNEKINPEIADSLEIAKPDSTILYNPMDRHGSVSILSDRNYINVNKKDLKFREYFGFSDMMENFIPAYPLSLGNTGMFNSFSIFASSSSSMAVTFNNRPVFDPEYSSLNIEQLSPEFFENAEVITGSDAVILSDNSSGALLNIQEIKHNTKFPFTKLWYAQGGEGFLSADGIFSQNIAPNLNFTFGFRRQTGNGKYENSWLDTWNVRGLLRWNPSNLLSISLVDYFSNHGSGLNGGIDRNISLNDSREIDIFHPDWAKAYYNTLEQRVFRHDITLNLTSYLSQDSTTALTGNLFVSNSDWEMTLSDNLLQDAPDSSKKNNHSSLYYGGYARIENSSLKFLNLRAGSEFYYINLGKSVYNDELQTASIAAFGLAEFNIFDFLKISGGMRVRNYNNQTISSQGIKLILDLKEQGILTSDISLSERMPSPTEGFHLKNEKNFLFLNDYQFVMGNVRINLGVFFRTIMNQILFDSLYHSINEINNRQILGVYLSLNTRLFKHLVIDATINNHQVIEENTDSDYLPSFYTKLSAYYEIHSGASILRLGISGRTVSSFTGQRYLPQYRSYTPYDMESNFMFDGLKVFAAAKLGNAYVKASYQNILFRDYYFVPVYPFYDGHFRLSFMWSLLD
ncbi:putative porin [Bacteroidota bacterium]